MSLPVLPSRHEASPDDLVRLFHRTELHWTQHLSEEVALPIGSAFTNPRLDQVHDANRMLDVALPEGVSPAQAVELVEGHFHQAGTRCWSWVMNPAAQASQTAPMVEHLRAQAYVSLACDIMHLQQMPRSAVRETPGLQIIPARASFRHAQQLADEAARRWNCPQLAEAAMMHLDDPHWDAWIALHEGKAVAGLGVLAVGEVGLVEEVFVVESHRRQGIGRTMMGRALEICARALFRHVLLGVDPLNTPAITLYEQFGFRKVGQLVAYRSPA